MTKLETDGSIKCGKSKNIIFEEEFGELTCWYTVQCDDCKKDCLMKTTLPPVSEDSALSPVLEESRGMDTST